MTSIKTGNIFNTLFSEKKDILSVYFTAGFPELEDTTRILLALQESGADIIEIGMPFSDPIADGPTIQASNTRALNNGMSIEKLFSQLESIKDQIKIPLVLMGYINPVLQFGPEQFAIRCQQAGVKGLILPDLPLKEYESNFKSLFQKHDLSHIFLITPQTSEERIRAIDALTDSFIYTVSSNSITGSHLDFKDLQVQYYERIRAMKLTNPTLIGFGIHDRTTFQEACKYAQGAIIGSAFIKVLEASKDLENDIKIFVKNIKGV